jgi:hypothetical protein
MLSERGYHGHVAAVDAGLDCDQGTMRVISEAVAIGGRCRASVRLQGVAHTDTSQYPIADLLPQTR